MKEKDFRSIANAIATDNQQLAIHGSLLFRPPVHHFLRGISFEGSSFDKVSFYATVFVLPLFVPTANLQFTFGHRLRKPDGGERWDFGDDLIFRQLSKSVSSQGLSFLDRVTSPPEFLEVAREFSIENPHVEHAICLANALAGRFEEALVKIDKFISRLDASVPWQVTLGRTAECLKEAILSGTAHATLLLETWEKESLKNMRLEPLRKE